MEAWLSSETDTTATIGWKIGCRQKSAALYGQVAYCYVDGTQRGYCEGYLTSSSPSWKEVCSTSGTTTVSKTSAARSVPVTVKTRVQPVNDYGSVTSAWAEATAYVSIKAITYYAPNAPSNCTNTRNSDTKNTVSWTAPTTSTTKPVNSIKVERSVDGGSWSQIASVGGSTTSYSDATTSADHSYQYRVRSYNTAGYSSYAASGTTYNTPSAPTSITASRLAEKKVSLTIANAARTATALELQRSTDQSTWEDVATISGSPVTATEDEPGGGTFWYRARNTRGSLVSAWSSVSNAVVTICAPNAPALIAPASGVTLSMATLDLVFSWKHSPIDGSSQTFAELRYRSSNGEALAAEDEIWTTVAVEGETQSASIGNAFEVNSTITWSVRTKGAHEDFGPWSSNRVFYLRQEPSVSFAAPADGFIVKNTPIRIALQYDDASGSLANASLTVMREESVVYSLDMGTETSAEISAEDWLPQNKESYTLSISVRSTSTLTASAMREVTVDYVLPQPAKLDLKPDDETGYMSVFVGIEANEEMAEVASISVYRITEEGRMLLGSGLEVGTSVSDRFAPLNTDYSYEAVSFADSGAVNTVVFMARIDSSWAYLYFSNGLARGMWNPQTTYDIEPAYKLVHYAGRKYPVGYMRDNLTEAHTVKVTLMERDEARAFRKMADACEPVVAKTWDGLVFHAIPVLKFAPVSGTSAYWGEVSVGLERIDGDAL